MRCGRARRSRLRSGRRQPRGGRRRRRVGRGRRRGADEGGGGGVGGRAPARGACSLWIRSPRDQHSLILKNTTKWHTAEITGLQHFSRDIFFGGEFLAIFPHGMQICCAGEVNDDKRLETQSDEQKSFRVEGMKSQQSGNSHPRRLKI